MTEHRPLCGHSPAVPVSQYGSDIQDDGSIHSDQNSHDATQDNLAGIEMRLGSLPAHSPDFPSKEGNGKAKGLDAHSSAPASASGLLALPAELWYNILIYLSPADLNHVSETCRAMYGHATADHLWQTLVQDNVPGQRVTSSYPCPTFRELFKRHDPRWFLPKYKIWFSDSGLPGRLIVVRYDQWRGCIEGYQLVANDTDHSVQTWQGDGESTITDFNPEVKLHLDHPILHLPADHVTGVSETDPIIIRLSRQGSNEEGADASEASSSSKPTTKDEDHQEGNRFQAEMPMRLVSDSHLRSSFIHARLLSELEVSERCAHASPYNQLWPPTTVPTPYRVLSVCGENPDSLRPEDVANCRGEVFDRAFRIRKWIEMRILGMNVRLLPERGHRLIRVGEEVSTYATLDPELYTPTPDRPYRGIWVGQYGAHGCEFLWINQPDDGRDNTFNPNDITRLENESDEDYERRKRDATVYRGRLEAVKLTGDANVPRGEYTFVAEDLGEGGFVRVEDEPPFEGVRVVKSKGHVADNGFVSDFYIDCHLMLISPDRLAHHWIDLKHISYYQRVDIDQFLVPN
ncbi:hypothetical protein C8A03DRAFT_44625 [Achaetomium macrosporum]|uniref:F-box domain-containing protein n=1 Tax=Achaetomium macrosporum TaxID=79813 RepID=A0AAN7C8V6_9PEZI|nr:hypothetical protein C8A03DRAFT_44625 [Achaetomium macrosporum]